MKFTKKANSDNLKANDFWKVLVVDDEESVHTVTEIVLKTFHFKDKKIKIIDAYSAKEAREILKENSDISLVLLDVVMETNEAGLELVKYIRKELNNKEIRIVIRTGQPGIAPEEKVIVDYDINDYKEKTELTSSRLLTTVYAAIRSYQDICSVKQLQKDKLKNYEQTLYTLVDLIEKRGNYTAGHTKRVAKYCVLIAKAMEKFNQTEIDVLFRAAMLHDIGKIVTPDTVLLKPGKLNELEYKLIQEHLNTGYEILSQIDMYAQLAEIMHCHHERCDGKGYPRGLQGDEIPVFGQIMIVADAFDAMTTNRIYKKKKSLKEALEELEELSAKQFHPEIVKYAKIALSNIGNLDEINQVPHTQIEEERFAYFFKDFLTGAYNENYLNTILSQGDDSHQYINLINLHNFSSFNKKHGWKNGDIFLKEIVIFLRKQYSNTLIFRIQGDDFVIVSKNHIEIEAEYLNNIKLIKNSEIWISVKHLHFKEENITSTQALEQLLSNASYE